MQPSAPRDAYLHTEVMTATPQKLQLMLIEAMMRFARQAQVHWQQGQDEQAGEAVIRCQEIVSELLCGLRPEQNPELTQQIAAIYMFLFRRLCDAHVGHDSQAIDDVVRVLEVERETWRQVCEQLGSRLEIPAPHINVAHSQAFVV